MTDRRYNDDEVSAIFARAAEGPPTPPVRAPADEGLTLAELQAIGREVGIAPDAVAHAARSVDAQPRALARTFAGLPIGVHRTIDLGRRMTDAEWELLVVELREVFRARGAVRADGSFRQWTNGNLQALLEPTPTGHRLRLSTFNAAARAAMTAGIATLGAAAVIGIAAAAAGHVGAALPEVAVIVLVGVTMIASRALRLPGWARRRAQQFDAIADGVSREPAATLPAERHDLRSVD